MVFIMASLRETKKARTRQRIADVATRMFVGRGFEAVTIAEIAEAAEVSKVTVFNYFHRKEDIFFDRMPEIRSLLADAVAERGERTPLVAVRDLWLDLEEQGHPLGGLRDGYADFWRTVLASPALRARARELVDELTDHLGALFSEAYEGDTMESRSARLVAALVIAVVREAFLGAARRMLAGELVTTVNEDYRQALRDGFDLLCRGIG